MDAEKLLNIVTLVGKLKKQQDEAQATLHKMVFAIAHQHLKENEVSQTVFEWEETKAALQYMLGISNHYNPGRHAFVRRLRPTHIRIFDLRPVRVKRNSETGFYMVSEPVSRVAFEGLDAEELANRYISINLEES